RAADPRGRTVATCADMLQRLLREAGRPCRKPSRQRRYCSVLDGKLAPPILCRRARAMTVGMGHDEQNDTTMVFVRTSTGAWQPVCDESGLAINIRLEAKQSKQEAYGILQRFARAEKVFSGWW